MIVQMFMVIFILGAILICDVIGDSYSNVYVEREIVPMRYYQYGTPYQPIANPRLSQINTLPPLPGYVTPCVAPCVYTARTVPSVTPVDPIPDILTYNSPVPSVDPVPIVVTSTKKEAAPYEYSYVVYDENTGDHKAQRELSDGSVVRGEYSFLQPDGYVREVQYVADDISGFNAVVRNFLPTTAEGKRKVEGQENKESSPPCHEIKNESLKEGLEEDSDETSIKQLVKIYENLRKKHSDEESAEKPKENNLGKSKESGEEENSKDIHKKETKKVVKQSGEEFEAVLDTKEKQDVKPSKEESEEASKEKSKESSEEEILNKTSKESTGESKETDHQKAKKQPKESEEVSKEESASEESKEELNEKSRKKSAEENKKKPNKGSKEASDENSEEKSIVVSRGKHREVQELLKPTDEVIVPYKDILRCIEAAMRRNYGIPAAMRQGPSPLTYIVLNKPC